MKVPFDMLEEAPIITDEMPVACEPCWSRKRKCDRRVPACTRCQQISIACYYDTYQRPEPPQRRAERGKRRGNNHARIVRSPSARGPYPIEFRWYMPNLIREYCEGLGISRVAPNPHSTTYKLQSVWVQHAFSDPCLFHATLFAGSSHFDLMRGEKPSATTLFHQSEAIRLINEHLSDPVWALDDRTIAAITPLSFFANFAGNREESDIHAAGLQRMIRLRGGVDKLGLGGVVATLTRLNNIIRTIVFDIQSGRISQGYHVLPPLGLECRILRQASPGEDDPVIDLFRDVYRYKLRLTRHGSAVILLEGDELQSRRTDSAVASLIATNPIFCCSYIAVSIFLCLISDSADPMRTIGELSPLVDQLKANLALTEESMWLQCHPIVYIWICATGAAAAIDTATRIWFYVRQANTLMALDTVDDPSFLEELLVHVHWLRNRRFQIVSLTGDTT